MNAQPEALRLADLLESCPLTVGDAQQAVAAAELRRLHAECEALRNVAKRGGHIAVAMSRIDQLEAQRDVLLEALKLARSIIGHPDDAHSQMIDAAIKAAEEAK